MCGRYAMDVSPGQLPQYLGRSNLVVDKVSEPQYDHAGSYNIGPTNTAPIYYYESNGSRLSHIVQYLKWGLIPHWTKNKEQILPWKRFNARLESLNSNTGLWVSSKNRKRCVVPLHGYFEWLHKPVRGTKKVDKIPYYIKRKDGELMYLAGLRDSCKLEGSDEWIHSYTIITGPAPDQLRWLHERMPVVLTPGTKEFETWLNPEIQEWGEPLLKCLQLYQKKDLEWYEVSQKVNKYSNSGEELVQPVKDNQKGIASFFNLKRISNTDSKQDPHGLEKSVPELELKQEQRDDGMLGPEDTKKDFKADLDNLSKDNETIKERELTQDIYDQKDTKRHPSQDMASVASRVKRPKHS